MFFASKKIIFRCLIYLKKMICFHIVDFFLILWHFFGGGGFLKIFCLLLIFGIIDVVPFFTFFCIFTVSKKNPSFVLRMSRSNYPPPWILKRGWLESSGRRLISWNGKTKRNAFSFFATKKSKLYFCISFIKILRCLYKSPGYTGSVDIWTCGGSN